MVDVVSTLLLEELPYFLEDVRIAREAYEKRAAFAERHRDGTVSQLPTPITATVTQ